MDLGVRELKTECIMSSSAGCGLLDHATPDPVHAGLAPLAACCRHSSRDTRTPGLRSCISAAQQSKGSPPVPACGCLTAAIPVHAAAPLPVVALPALPDARWPGAIPHLLQPGSDDVCPRRVEGHRPQVQGSCLEGCPEHLWDGQEQDVPHEQAKQGGPDASLSMHACRHQPVGWSVAAGSTAWLKSVG